METWPYAEHCGYFEKTGLTLHNFQSWRRGDSNLLPKPVAVDKKVIYFDDSILKRVKFIRKQQAAGKTLAQIEELLQAELAEEAKVLPTAETLRADTEDFMGELHEFTKKWEKAECHEEVCAALNLEPAFTSPASPTLSLFRLSANLPVG